jgi:hypothetical protein
MSVPTPTGTLQGVAAFNWDGAVWQPAGRAGPSVATPTGNLQGVAAFSGVPPQPAGRAGPGVPTPTGVLDGVAVYTWSGSQWTPPGGSPTPSTPSGALRGVAAFDWDGAAWQPAGQAGPDVATPYGVLQGVARFGWTGSAWAATGAPSFQRDFTSGSLGAGAVFTRASIGTYYNSGGVLVSAATNAPRFDYDPATLQLKGVLLEDASTNLCLQSSVGVAPWSPFGTSSTTANNAVAPDGTTSATRILYPAVTAGGTAVWYQQITVAAASYAFSVWLRGASGGEQIYLCVNPTRYSSPRITLTTQWQRFTFITPVLTAAAWAFEIGTDLNDPLQTSTPAQTIFAWGAQVELNFMSSYIPTTAAAASRAADALSYPIASVTGFSTTQGSLLHEYILEGVAVVGFNSSVAFVGAVPATDYMIPEQFDGTGTSTTPSVNAAATVVGATNAYCLMPPTSAAAGPVHRAAMGWSMSNVVHAAYGGVGDTSNSGVVTALPVITGLTIGDTVHSQSRVSQWARRTRYWPRQLSQAELISVTS